MNDKNKVLYYIVDNEQVLGTVYEHPQYGRTLVLAQSNMNLNSDIRVMRVKGDGYHEKVSDSNLVDFFQSMIPSPVGLDT